MTEPLKHFSRFLSVVFVALGLAAIAATPRGNIYLHIAYASRLIILLIYVVITETFWRYTKDGGGAVSRYFLLSVLAYQSSFLYDLFLVLAINQEEVSLVVVRFLYILIFMATISGAFFFLLFILVVSGEGINVVFIWPPIYTIGVLTTYFTAGNPVWEFYAFNNAVDMRELRSLFHPIFNLTISLNFSSIALVCTYVLLVKHRDLSSTALVDKSRRILLLGVYGVYMGLGPVYVLHSILPVDSVVRFVWVEIITPYYIMTFSTLIYLPLILNPRLGDIFRIQVDSFYIFDEKGLTYLAIEFRESKKEVSDMLLSASLSAIQIVLSESGISSTDLKKIQLEDRYLYFYKSEGRTYMIISKEENVFLEERLVTIADIVDSIIGEPTSVKHRDSPELINIVKELLGMDE